MTMEWKGVLRKLFGAATQPVVFIKPKCPICGLVLETFPGSPFQMCENGHKFGEGMKRVDLINDGEFRGDL